MWGTNEASEGGTVRTLCRPSGALDLIIRMPTAEAVGYDISSLWDYFPETNFNSIALIQLNANVTAQLQRGDRGHGPLIDLNVGLNAGHVELS